MKPSLISTPRLILRNTIEGDAKNLFEHYCSKLDSSRYLTRHPHKDVNQTYEFLTKWCNVAWQKDSASFAWVIAAKENNEAIGVFLVEVGVDKSKIQIHYGIGTHFSNQGLITEAGFAIISWLSAQQNIQKIWTVCDLENFPSIKVLTKLGFKNEGILKSCLTLPTFGEIARDCYIYGLQNAPMN